MGVDALVTNSTDIAALLGALTSDQEETSKCHPLAGPDLSHYQSSSSSGHSSPEHDDDADGPQPGQPGFRVDDLEMWEVLEALEMPGLPPVSHEEMLLNPGRISPDPSMSGRGLNVAASSLSPPPKGKATSGNLDRKPGQVKRPLPTNTITDLDVLQDQIDVHAPAGSDSADDGDPNDMSGDATEEKRLKRMRRNRESAAMSRNRKKAYIEELETKVTTLASTVQQLQSDNRALQQECHALKTQCANTAGVNLLALPGDDGMLSRDSFAEQPSASGGTRSNMLHASRKLGTASLALASTLALVTLSVTSSDVLGDHTRILSNGRSPISRVLMSMPENQDVEPLWPALNVAHEMQHAAAFLPSPPEATPTIPASAKLQPEGSERVVLLPPNSSWQDALRTEKAFASTLDAIDHPSSLGRSKVIYEPDWREEDAYPGVGAFLSSEAQRFIFCSRAFAFDVSHAPSPRASSHHGGGPARQPQQLPAAMPARFRHAAAMPQLTDGSLGSNASDLPEPRPTLPIVSLLLPTAALRGLILPAKEQAADTELMQVQCQVLNASRFGV